MNRNDLRRVDLNLLIVFETLMHERSVTRAAEKLFLGQPAISAALACINNLGPGLNEVGPAGNYAMLSSFQLWVLSFAMLLGRLELLTVLVILVPAFWRK